MLAAFEDIRLEPNSMTGSCTSPQCQTQPSAVADYTIPVDTGCLSALLASCQQITFHVTCQWLACCNKHFAHIAPFEQQLAEREA